MLLHEAGPRPKPPAEKYGLIDRFVALISHPKIATNAGAIHSFRLSLVTGAIFGFDSASFSALGS